MKKLVILVLFFASTVHVSAQIEQPPTNIEDTNRVDIYDDNPEDEPEINFIEEFNEIRTGISRNSNWSGLDFGVGMLFTPNWESNFVDQPHLDFDPARSWTVNLNFFEHYFSIAGDYFGLVTGLGANWSHFGYRRNYTINYDEDSIGGFVDPNRKYSKNRIRAAYLQIPLLFQINLKSKTADNFHLSFGVVGGVRVGSNLKQKFLENSNKFKINEKRGDFHFNAFKADATVRLGFGDWGAFASYNLVPLFNTNVVEPVHNLSFGLMFNF